MAIRNEPQSEKSDRYTRLYSLLVLAADNLDPTLVHKWIMEWGDLNVPRLSGRTLLDAILDNENIPRREQARLVGALLGAGARVTETHVDRAAARGRGRVLAALLQTYLGALPEAAREAALGRLQAKWREAPVTNVMWSTSREVPLRDIAGFTMLRYEMDEAYFS